MISDTEKSYLLTMERHPTDRDSIQHELKEQPYLAEDRIPRNSRFLHGRSDPMPLDWETRNLTTREIINISYKSYWQHALDHEVISFDEHKTLKFFSIITNKSHEFVFNNCRELQYIYIICHNTTNHVTTSIINCPKLQTIIIINPNNKALNYTGASRCDTQFIHVNTINLKNDELRSFSGTSKSFRVELPEELNINTEQQISDMELHYKNSNGSLLSSYSSHQFKNGAVLWYRNHSNVNNTLPKLATYDA